MASSVDAAPSLTPLNTDHRRLLNPHRPDDSPITDQEDQFDDVLPELVEASLVGVSISHAQTYMKSPETPAIEKQRVLDQSLDYFDPGIAADAIAEGSQQPPPGDSTSQPGPTQPQPRVPSPWRAHPSSPSHRSSLAGALGEAKNVTKRRSLSGSNMFESLKKMLPEMPSIPSRMPQSFYSSFISREPATNDQGSSGSLSVLQSRPYFSSFTNDNSARNEKLLNEGSTSGAPDSRNTYQDRSAPKQRPELQSKPLFSYIGGSDGADLVPTTSPEQVSHEGQHGGDAQAGAGDSGSQLYKLDTSDSGRSKRHSDPPLPPSAVQDLPAALDGNAESFLTPTTPGRRNSDGSLYLSRKLTTLSTYDDTSAFAHVSEMANSRFKAITDSFQSSTIRFPRLPNVRTNFGWASPSDDETVRNTQLNSQSSSKDRASSRDREKLYTNLHNIRKSKRLIEIETSQTRAHPVLSSAFDELEGDLMIIGGYRGSILREAKPPNRQLWAPVKVGLNLRKADLEVGLTREDEEKAAETIIPSGVLSHIGPIDICRRLLKHTKKCANVKNGTLRLHDWGYDWRLSPDLLAGRLIKYLESLECNQPSTAPERRGVWMIAHSLGGLITRYAVNLRPELFAGILFAGTPMNCVNILGPLRNGDDVLLSSKVLTAQVNFTIRTSYALLPEDGRCFINKETNERYDLDFFDPQTWEDWHLSPCIKPALDPSSVAKQRDRSKSLVGLMAQSVTSLPRPSFLGSTPDSTRSDTMTSKSSHSRSQDGSTKPDTTTQPQTSTAHRDASASAASLSTSLDPFPPIRPSGHGQTDNSASEAPGEAVLEPTMGSSATPAHKSSVATACTLDPAAAREYLGRTLAETLAFKRALKHNPAHQTANRYPPHALIFGKTVPTVYGAKVASREAIKFADAFDDLAFAAGDGVVLASAAQLPEGYRVVKGGRIESDRGHVGLLGDLEGVGAALHALMEGRRRGVGMGCFGVQ